MDEESSYASVGKKDVLRDTTDDLVIESHAMRSFNPSYASTIGHQEVVISRDDTELFHSPTNVNSVYATQNTSMTDNRSSPKELTLTDQTNFPPVPRHHLLAVLTLLGFRPLSTVYSNFQHLHSLWLWCGLFFKCCSAQPQLKFSNRANKCFVKPNFTI